MGEAEHREGPSPRLPRDDAMARMGRHKRVETRGEGREDEPITPRALPSQRSASRGQRPANQKHSGDGRAGRQQARAEQVQRRCRQQQTGQQDNLRGKTGINCWRVVSGHSRQGPRVPPAPHPAGGAGVQALPAPRTLTEPSHRAQLHLAPLSCWFLGPPSARSGLASTTLPKFGRQEVRECAVLQHMKPKTTQQQQISHCTMSGPWQAVNE